MQLDVFVFGKSNSLTVKCTCKQAFKAEKYPASQTRRGALETEGTQQRAEG